MNGIEPGDLTTISATNPRPPLRVGQVMRYWIWGETSLGVKGTNHHTGVVVSIHPEIEVRRVPAGVIDIIHRNQIVYHSGEPVEQSNEPSTLIDSTIMLDMKPDLASDLLKGAWISILDTHGSTIEVGRTYSGGMLILTDNEVVAEISEEDANRLVHLMHVLWG